MTWVTYERPHWSRGSKDRSTITRLENERAPSGNYDMRRATQAEIDAETAKREAAQKERDIEAAFKARPEYAEAKRIGDLLEWMSPTDHPLDRLTLAEWMEFRRKLDKP